MAFRAIRACWHKKRFYNVGTVWAGEGRPPRHFVEDKDFSVRAVDEAAREEKLKRVAVKTQKAGEEVATGPTGGNAKKP